MNLELRQLRQFAGVVEAGSFRRAAEVLHVAQPALSVSVQKLENAVGVRLLKRLPTGVVPTAAGAALLLDAKRSIFFAEQSQLSARRVALGEMGELRLGFIGSATYSLLPGCLPRYRERYPDVQVTLHEHTSLRLIDMLLAYEVDAAVIRGPVIHQHLMDAYRVETDDLVAVLPATHPLAERQQISLAALCAEEFVLYSRPRSPVLFSLAYTLCQRAGFTPRISQEAISVQTVVSLVASGMGVALVPGVVAAYRHARVRFVALEDAGAKAALSLSLVLLRDTANPAAMRLKEAMTGTAAAAAPMCAAPPAGVLLPAAQGAGPAPL